MTCKVCESPDLAEIESMRADGAPLRAIARQFGLSKDSLSRHVRSDHGGVGQVIPVASRGALLSPDLTARAHALLAASDRAVREAEHSPGSLGLLRALRGHRAALRSAIWARKAPEGSFTPVSDADRAQLEANWKRAVTAFEGTEGRPGPRLMALQGLREALDQLFKASPPSGAKLIRFALVFPGGHVERGAPFWTSNAQLIAAAEGGKPISLDLSWPAPGRDRNGGG